MSAREYAEFYLRTFDPRSLAFMSQRGHDFLSVPPTAGFIPDCTGCNYGLGVLVFLTGRPPAAALRGPTRNIWHAGDWNHSGTTPSGFHGFAAHWDNGYAAIVVYDGIPTFATVLDNDLRNAAFRTD